MQCISSEVALVASLFVSAPPIVVLCQNPACAHAQLPKLDVNVTIDIWLKDLSEEQEGRLAETHKLSSGRWVSKGVTEVF